MEKNLVTLKKMIGFDFTASAQVGHALHQAHQVAGMADKLRTAIDALV